MKIGFSGKSQDTLNIPNSWNNTRSKIPHICNILNKVKCHIKGTWTELLPLLGKLTGNDPVNEQINSQRVIDPRDIANAFGDYFATVGSELQNSIPNSKISYKEYFLDPEAKR